MKLKECVFRNKIKEYICLEIEHTELLYYNLRENCYDRCILCIYNDTNFLYYIYTHIYVDILCRENRNRDYEKVCKHMSC